MTALTVSKLQIEWPIRNRHILYLFVNVCHFFLRQPLNTDIQRFKLTCNLLLCGRTTNGNWDKDNLVLHLRELQFGLQSTSSEQTTFSGTNLPAAETYDFPISLLRLDSTRRQLAGFLILLLPDLSPLISVCR